MNLSYRSPILMQIQHCNVTKKRAPHTAAGVSQHLLAAPALKDALQSVFPQLVPRWLLMREFAGSIPALDRLFLRPISKRSESRVFCSSATKILLLNSHKILLLSLLEP